MLGNKAGVNDHSYDIRFEENKWMNGDTKFEIYCNNFIINNVHYKGTSLYELVF